MPPRLEAEIVTDATVALVGVPVMAPEVALIAKTTPGRFDELAERVRALHSYGTPAIVAWPIVAGATDYLEWIEAETALPSE